MGHNGKFITCENYDGNENYLNSSIKLMNKKPNEDLFLEFGDHELKFQIKLPPRLPTAFEHSIGKIKYSLHGCIEIPWYSKY